MCALEQFIHPVECAADKCADAFISKAHLHLITQTNSIQIRLVYLLYVFKSQTSRLPSERTCFRYARQLPNIDLKPSSSSQHIYFEYDAAIAPFMSTECPKRKR